MKTAFRIYCCRKNLLTLLYRTTAVMKKKSFTAIKIQTFSAVPVKIHSTEAFVGKKPCQL